MSAIFQKEFKSFFDSMVGYVVVAFILLVTGIFTFANNLSAGYPNFEYVLSNISFVMLFVVPILTMRSVSEEKRSRTDLLLYALPEPMWQIILGKYLAMVAVFAIPCGVMALYPLLLSMYGTVAFLPAYSSLIAFFLLGCALIAIGMFMSSLTESQVISAVLSFGAMLLCYLMTGIAGLMPSTALASYIGFAAAALLLALLIYYVTKNYWIAFCAALVTEGGVLLLYMVSPDTMLGSFPSVLNWLAVFNRLDTFIYSGLFDLTAILYYLSVAFCFVWFTVQAMEKKKWS